MTRLDRGPPRASSVKSSPRFGLADLGHGQHKRRDLSDEEYIARYRPILDRVQLAVWTALAATPTYTFLCYCPPGVFCHSHVAIEYALARFPEWFTDGRASASIPRRYTLWP
jgi:hypothetical protein